MNYTLQTLLIISYAVFGLAAALFLPMAGVADSTAQFAGLLVFFGAWLVQTTFFQGSTPLDEIDIHRVEETEKLALLLKKEVIAIKASLEEQSEKGDAKDKKLVSELKLLQEYLMMIMQKEAGKGSKKAPKPGKAEITKLPEPPTADTVNEAKSVDAPDDETSEEEEEKLTAEAIEELGLTPEEAALVVVDEGTGDGEMSDADDGPDEGLAETVSSGEQAASQNEGDTRSTPPKSLPKAAALKATGKKRAPIRLIKREDQLLSVIKASLSENRIDLYLQPIVSLPSRKISHFECFSRVRDEEGRIVLPRQYMKVAETKGLIGTIDNLLLFRLIQLIRRLGKRKPDVRFFCNMSRYSISDEAFFPQFVDFMTSNVEFSSRLVFEISQEDYLTLDEDVVARLSTLGRKGFAFSMDLVTDFNQDFGALADHNFKYIKGDLSDIMAANPEPGDIEVQVAFLRRHGMHLIASRIENEDMVINALDNQIELAQGYLFGEPNAASDMNDNL